MTLIGLATLAILGWTFASLTRIRASQRSTRATLDRLIATTDRFEPLWRAK